MLVSTVQYSVKRNARFASEAFYPYWLWLDALRRRDVRILVSLLTIVMFAVNVRTRTRTYVVLLHVLAIRQRGTASARDRCPALHAQHAVTPIILNTKISRGKIS